MPEVTERQQLYAGKMFQVEQVKVRGEDESTQRREVVRHAPVVAIVALQEAGGITERGVQVVMVKQYRAPVEEEVLEIIAGHVEAGESPLHAAQRELLEETGLEAGEWIELGTLYSSPGFTDERVTLFIARALAHTEREHDAEAGLTLQFLPFTLALGAIRTGEIRDAKSVAGLLWASLHLDYEQREA